MKTLRYLLLIILSFSVVVFTACGGGGGSGSQSSSSSGIGTVAVYLADGPADEYDELWITVTEVTLIPSEGSGRSNVIVYQSDQGYKVDLLSYRDEDFLLTLKQIPAGIYKKIRLDISDIDPVGGPCTDMEIIKLPSGKIDLLPRETFEVEPGEILAIRLDIDANKSINLPRETFEVEPGEILAIRLDIDANKSINLHASGNSGKCIFRPVVFVDIEEPVEWQLRCPQILRGKIAGLIYINDDSDIEGFKLELPGKRGTLDVYLADDTVIFNDDGFPSGEDALEEGQSVWVRGRLDSEGHFQASEVVIGDVIILKGTVESAVDDDTFTLALDPGQPVTDSTISVALSDGTLILVGCEDETNRSAIKPGMPARVAGKLSVNDQLLQAVAVFLRPISGELISIDPADYGNGPGRDLKIQVDEDTGITVFLPESAPISLVGDGEVPISLLCNGRYVYAVIDHEQSEQLSVLTASEIKVQPDHLSGLVDDIDESERTLVVDSKTVYVQDNATILDLSGNVDKLTVFEKIEVGDKVNCFGLEDCLVDNKFYAFVILIAED
jgi:hypothetical protein